MRYDLPVKKWRKSSYSGDNAGSCIEVQAISEVMIAVGDSKTRQLGAFVFGLHAWSSFIACVKAGNILEPPE